MLHAVARYALRVSTRVCVAKPVGTHPRVQAHRCPYSEVLWRVLSVRADTYGRIKRGVWLVGREYRVYGMVV